MSVLVGVPCMEQIPVETVRCLFELNKTPGMNVMLYPSSLVYTARNTIALTAIESKFTHLMFIDSDMTFDADTIDRLMAHDKDIVSGLCFKRKAPFTPTIYRNIRPKSEGQEPTAEVVRDYGEGLIEIDGCGAAMMLIKTSVLTNMVKELGQVFDPLPGIGEDLSFCYRAGQLGHKLYCDTTVKAGHIGKTVITEHTYKGFNGL